MVKHFMVMFIWVFILIQSNASEHPEFPVINVDDFNEQDRIFLENMAFELYQEEFLNFNNARVLTPDPVQNDDLHNIVAQNPCRRGCCACTATICYTTCVLGYTVGCCELWGLCISGCGAVAVGTLASAFSCICCGYVFYENIEVLKSGIVGSLCARIRKDYHIPIPRILDRDLLFQPPVIEGQLEMTNKINDTKNESDDSKTQSQSEKYDIYKELEFEESDMTSPKKQIGVDASKNYSVIIQPNVEMKSKHSKKVDPETVKLQAIDVLPLYEMKDMN